MNDNKEDNPKGLKNTDLKDDQSPSSCKDDAAVKEVVKTVKKIIESKSLKKTS